MFHNHIRLPRFFPLSFLFHPPSSFRPTKLLCPPIRPRSDPSSSSSSPSVAFLVAGTVHSVESLCSCLPSPVFRHIAALSASLHPTFTIPHSSRIAATLGQLCECASFRGYKNRSLREARRGVVKGERRSSHREREELWQPCGLRMSASWPWTCTSQRATCTRFAIALLLTLGASRFPILGMRGFWVHSLAGAFGSEPFPTSTIVLIRANATQMPELHCGHVLVVDCWLTTNNDLIGIDAFSD